MDLDHSEEVFLFSGHKLQNGTSFSLLSTGQL